MHTVRLQLIDILEEPACVIVSGACDHFIKWLYMHVTCMCITICDDNKFDKIEVCMSHLNWKL